MASAAQVNSAQRIAMIDPRMAVAKCRQIVEAIAQRVYSRSLGAPGNKPLVNLVHELRESQVIPADVFTHYYNVRKQGNLDATLKSRDWRNYI